MNLQSQFAPVVAIVGPTATGKTVLALELVNALQNSPRWTGFDILSADSRQVYRGISVLSGADVPTKLPANTALHGIAMIELNQEWSLAHFRQFGRKLLAEAQEKHRLVIVVGGTGLYHTWLLSNEPDIDVQPDPELRAELTKLTVEELARRLGAIQPSAFTAMTGSDRSNPRRLIRAIEKHTNPPRVVPQFARHAYMPLFQVGLSAPLTVLRERIDQRVRERWQMGALTEVEKVLAKNLSPSLPSLTATGFKEIAAYLRGEVSAEVAQALWTQSEFKYAKRQLTWWKKHQEIEWFDVSLPSGTSRALQTVIERLY